MTGRFRVDDAGVAPSLPAAEVVRSSADADVKRTRSSAVSTSTIHGNAIIDVQPLHLVSNRTRYRFTSQTQGAWLNV